MALREVFNVYLIITLTIICKMGALRIGATLQKTLRSDSIIAAESIDAPSLNDCLEISIFLQKQKGNCQIAIRGF